MLSQASAEPETASTLPDNNGALPLLSIVRLNEDPIRYRIELDPSGSPLGFLVEQMLNDKLRRSNIQFGDEYSWLQRENVRITLLPPQSYKKKEKLVIAIMPERVKARRGIRC
jgi:hypothetical protein